MTPTINWLPSRPPVAVNAIQPAVLIQPVTHDTIGTQGLGDTIAAQWYCPADVGKAERNSASDAARHKLHIPAVMRPQITDVGPPDGSARERLAERAVHCELSASVLGSVILWFAEV